MAPEYSRFVDCQNRDRTDLSVDDFLDTVRHGGSDGYIRLPRRPDAQFNHGPSFICQVISLY